MSEASTLPQGWLEVTLDDLGMPKTTNVDPSKFPDEHFELWSVPNYPYGPEFSDGKEIGSSKQSVEPGDVLLCKINPRINRVEIVGAATDYRQIASSEWIVIRSECGDPAYVKHVLTAENFRKALLRDVSGVGGSLMRARPAAVRQLEVPVAPLNEQRRIVSKIEALESHREAAQEGLEAIPPLLERFQQSLLAAAFRGDLTREWRVQNRDVEPASVLLERIRTERKERLIEDAAETARAKAEAKARDAGKPWTDADDQEVLEKERGKAEKKYKEPEPVDTTDLPELPEGWCWAAAEELTQPGRSIMYGIIKGGPDTPGGVPTVRVMDITSGSLNVDLMKRCHPDRAAKFERAKLNAGDVLISKDGTIGRVAIVPPELDGGNITQHVLRFSPHSEILNHWLAAVISAPMIQAWMRGETKGVALQGVNVGDFRVMPLPLCPAAEQTALAELLEERLEWSESAHLRCGDAMKGLIQLTQSILAKAFRGELVPQDPNDEPASMLLERIRAERAEADAQDKPKKKAARKTTKKATGKQNGGKASS